MKFELIICKHLEQEFINAHSLVNYKEKKEYFLDQFKQGFLTEFTKINKIHSLNVSTINIKIYVNSSDNDLIKSSLSIKESSDSIFCFYLYANLYSEFFGKKKGEIFFSFILHELIHILDIAILKETEKEFYFNKLQLKPIHLFHSSLQWMFIHLLSNFRNEGVAILGEKLLNKTVTTLSENEVMQQFENDLNLGISLCHSTAFKEKIDLKELKSIILSIENNAYKYADVILFNLIIKKNSIKFNGTIQEYMNDNKGIPVEQILKAAFEFDLSEWIREIFKMEHDPSANLQINYTKFIELCDFIVRKEKNINNAYDLKNILLYANQRDVLNFLEVIKNCTKSKMDLVAINSQFKLFKEKSSIHDVHFDLLQLVANLLEIRNTKNQDIVDWSLSYLFAKEDFIDDELTFLGMQDDWMVIEGATILLESTK